MNYYNENDPNAAAWLLGLMEDGLIPQGHVDARSIEEVRPADLVGYTQCHFFAGIGGWPFALRLAGWPEDRPVWTASCPCQPFSNSGKRQGESDSRHLWPVFARLVDLCKPPDIFGEQVASSLGRIWLSRVRSDLEGMAYGVGAADLCSASVGSPNIRQRLYWMSVSERRATERSGHEVGGAEAGVQGEARQQRIRPDNGNGSPAIGLAKPDSWGLYERAVSPGWRSEGEGEGDELRTHGGMEVTAGTGLARAAGQELHGRFGRPSVSGSDFGVAKRLGNADCEGLQERIGNGRVQPEEMVPSQGKAIVGGSGPAVGLGQPDSRGCGQGNSEEFAGNPKADAFGQWSEFDVVQCRDGKSRRIPKGSLEPSLQCMAHGLQSGLAPLWHQGYPLSWEKIESRVALLKGIGNAINPYIASEFVRAAMSITQEEAVQFH